MIAASLCLSPSWAARGTSAALNTNVIAETGYGPLSGSNGPFTVAFWFKSGNPNPAPAYIVDASGLNGLQWSVIYGYSPQQIEFFTGDPTVRANSALTIGDSAWHHIAYRKSGPGTSAWDKFLDGVKIPINGAINFSLPAVSSLQLFNAVNGLAPCQCSIADILIYSSARPDAEMQSLAAGARPDMVTAPSLYWPLSGISTPEPDASGNNHPGLVQGNIFHVAAPPYSGAVARGASVASASNGISNPSFGPLSGSNGPFTIAFWFKSGNLNPTQTYIAEAHGPGQWSVIYGYTRQQIEFYTGDPTVRQNTGIAITDTAWHHIAYRKSASGPAQWDKFIDGVRTTINPSINFALPFVNSFFAFNADNGLAPCQCSIADLVVYGSARPDSEILGLSNGARPTLNPDPLVYWPLAATSLQEPDNSGNNHPGSVSGSVVATAGPPYIPTVARTIEGSSANLSISNTGFGPLSASNGPFTIALWFQSTNLTPSPSYIVEGFGGTGALQWSVIYGYTSQQIEFYTGNAVVRQNSGLPITDAGWHHVAYRKSAAGASAWDKFLDGVRIPISSSVNFSLPQVSSFYAFNADNGQALCHCNLGDIALYNAALSDSEVASLAQGARPLSVSEPPVLYWPLSGGLPEPDLSGNGNSGTITGLFGTTSPPPYAGTVSIVPPTATLSASANQQFTASVSGANSGVGWFVTPSVGNISTGGLYQAPSIIPAPSTVTISAVNASNATMYATSSVQLNPSGSSSSSSNSVLTAQYDTFRTGSNPQETALSPANVNVNGFGKLFSVAVDGYVYAQPLYVSASAVPGLGHNTLIVATMHNSLYAFDADSGGAPLWSVNFGSSVAITRDYLGPETGILSTPVIDPTRHAVYVVALNSDGWRLHAIDLLTHAEEAGSPVLIGGSVSGNGYDNVNGVVSFNPNQQLQRAALVLANSMVYVTFTSYADSDPYHGWIFGYNADTLAQTAIYNTTPNGGEGSVWMGGAGPAVDENGDLYVVAANGTWDGVKNFSQSFLKLSPSLSVLDWFTPADWASLDGVDADLGSTRAMLLPSTTLVIGGGKDGILWVLNRATGQMGHLQGGAGNPPIVETFHATTDLVTSGIETNGLWDGLAYWNPAPGGPLLYLWGSDDVLRSFRLLAGSFSTAPVAQTSLTRPFPGGVLAVSSNAGSGGIVWASTPNATTNVGTASGVLRAFDPMTLTELWNSSQNATRDAVGTFSKFSAPTVVNGKVYLATFSNQVVVYGLLH
jgi:hypothetical protein